MPQPIDLQTEMGRLTQVDRIQQVMDRASLAAEQRFAAQTQENQILSETQIQETHTTSEQVEAEARRRNPYIGRRKRRDHADDSSESSDAHNDNTNAGELPVIASDEEGSTLDVSV